MVFSFYLCNVIKHLEIMNTIQFIPQENLDQYNSFTIRSSKNGIKPIKIDDYESAFIVYKSLVKTLVIKDDVTLEGVNIFNNETHTIWYSHKRQCKIYSFFYDKNIR
jgi:hypothetical protein